jgi:hypothetical protein
MNLLTLYLEKVPTNDPLLSGSKMQKFDVVAYRDQEKTEVACRWPWYYSNKPTKRNKTVMMNCYRWNIEWI